MFSDNPLDFSAGIIFILRVGFRRLPSYLGGFWCMGRYFGAFESASDGAILYNRDILLSYWAIALLDRAIRMTA